MIIMIWNLKLIVICVYFPDYRIVKIYKAKLCDHNAYHGVDIVAK